MAREEASMCGSRGGQRALGMEIREGVWVVDAYCTVRYRTFFELNWS